MLANPLPEYMNNELQIIIDHFNKEKTMLQNLLDDCLKEEDYKYARLYLKNLRWIEMQLTNLLSLSDYNYKTKTEIKRLIKNATERLERYKKENNSFIDYLNEDLRKLNNKLLMYENLPIKGIEEKYDIENAIINLCEKNITGFKILVEKASNFYFGFSLMENDIIKFIITPLIELHKPIILELQNIGFTFDESKLFLFYNHDLNRNSIKSLMILLSKILFEILYPFQFNRNYQLIIY